MRKRITAALLACLMLVGLMPTAMAAQVSDAQIIDKVLAFLYVHEGNYGSINKNDNGALSVGKIQWYAGNALNLCRDALNRNPQSALEVLGEDLYNEITDSTTNWSHRIVNDEEAALLSAFLTTPEGKAAQDDQGRAYMTNYINAGKKLGITDPAVMVYFCDLHNQGGLGMARRVATAAAEMAGSFGAISLDQIYQAGLDDSVAGRYPNRRKATYDYCKSLGWEVNTGKPVTPPVTQPTPSKVKFPKVATYKQGQFYDVSASKWYNTNVARAVEYGLMKGQGANVFSPEGNVTIAETITMAARIHSIYTTGSANFKQTSGARWYEVYFNYAYNNKIVTAEYYWHMVNEPATRAQFAEIFAKALPAAALPAKNTVANNAIPDVPSSLSYAGAVYTLYRAGILTGSDGNYFYPNSTINRAQAAAMASRMADSDLRMSVTLK